MEEFKKFFSIDLAQARDTYEGTKCYSVFSNAEISFALRRLMR